VAVVTIRVFAALLHVKALGSPRTHRAAAVVVGTTGKRRIEEDACCTVGALIGLAAHFGAVTPRLGGVANQGPLRRTIGRRRARRPDLGRTRPAERRYRQQKKPRKPTPHRAALTVASGPQWRQTDSRLTAASGAPNFSPYPPPEFRPHGHVHHGRLH